MSSSVSLDNNPNAAIAHAFFLDDNQSAFIRPLFTATYRTNFSLSHIPGPPPLFLTSTIINPLDDRYYSYWLLIIIAVFGSITSVLTVLGNILVMLAFFLDRQIRQPTNYFILSLAVSDFLIGLLSIPFFTIYIYAKTWPLNAIICDIWLSLDYTVCLTSIYTVLFITIDRFCSVKMPAKYRKWRTKKRINIMIAISWAVPTVIFFTSTMLYPRLKGSSNLQSGVCDVQWNKNHVFNLGLTIAYFWTTLFVMIVLYIFIYGVAKTLEKKSRDNARKMSSLVGMAGNAMTQIGVGIGVKKSPTKISLEKQNHKIDLTRDINLDLQSIRIRKMLNKKNSSNSSERRHTNDGGDDENSNSFESHSDVDLSNINENKFPFINTKFSQQNRRGMSVNWGSNSTTAVNLTSTRNPPHPGPFNQKNSSHVKSFAHSLYKNPMRLGSLSPASKIRSTTKNSQQSPSLTPIASEPELALCRVPPPPQPRPESLAIMSEELFHEKLKARQSPLLPIPDLSVQPSLPAPAIVDNHLSTSTICLENNSMEDTTQSSQTISIPSSPEKQQENLIEISSEQNLTFIIPQSHLLVEPIVNHIDESSDESWRLLNSNSSLDIPYIDETDFEDLGYILHRRCVPPNDSNGLVHEETIVYKSPLYIKHKRRSKSALTSPANTNGENKIYEIHGNHYDAHKAILESPAFENVELITYACTKSNPVSETLPIRHCSLRHVPRKAKPETALQPSSLPLSSNDLQSSSSIIFLSKARTSLLQSPVLQNQSPSVNRHADVERALIDFYQCSQIDDGDDILTTSESDVLSNYNEINQETSSLLRLNEQYSSAFIDDEINYQHNNHLMKMMILNKTNLDTTSDDQTLTNSVSLNTYSQDFSVDKIFQQLNFNEYLSRNSWTSSSSISSCQDRLIPEYLLAAIQEKRDTSSDSDAITTTTTTLTTSTLFGGSDKRKLNDSFKNSETCPILKNHHSDILIHDSDPSLITNRISSKVTFESLMTQVSVPSSPKTKDQSVMAQMDINGQLNWSNHIPELVQAESQIKNGRVPVVSEGTLTSSTVSAKSSVKELVQNQKSSTRRKSKSQNRARKALRTITFILGAFVVCWIPWHIYSAVHSLCESCKNNWIFSNPMFHCFYFLCYLNSPINPFCYALANQQFKKTFTRILKLDLRRL